LQTDIVAYQSQVKGERLKFFSEVSNLKINFENYTFTFDGITTYDDQEVYKINYEHRKDSILTTSGFKPATETVGSLFITTDSYAIVKTEERRYDGPNTLHATAYYRKYNDKYYPYHFIREGEHRISENHVYSFHIDLISLGIKHGDSEKFSGREPTKVELSTIPYDSLFWATATMLKTTPLEDKIISDLGGGRSLQEQFFLYQKYEENLSDGGVNGEEKFNWFKNESKNKRVLYIGFWDSQCESCILEIEYMKRWQQRYANKITFILLSLDNDEALWKQNVVKFNLFADGIINYRIGGKSRFAKDLKVNKTPKFVLISRDGNIFDSDAKRPSDALMENDFETLINQR
jgi:thiol-disulfide isomerase/thioredoxin